MGIYECLWVFMGVCGLLGVYGYLWMSWCLLVYMSLWVLRVFQSECIWVPIGIYRFLWVSGCLRVSMGIPRFLWVFMGIYRFPWMFLGIYGGFRVLGLFASFGFVSNIPRTHYDAQRPPHDFLFPSFGFVSNIPRTHHDAQRPPHDFLFPCFRFVCEFWV